MKKQGIRTTLLRRENMRARIVKPQMMYYGEVYIDGEWKRITSACHTEWGTKLELKRWKKEHHYSCEFEL